jgi:cupin 2 domain-containing protein
MKSFTRKETLMGPQNLFAAIPAQVPAELFSPLLQSANLRIERIVSHGQASPEGFWYDQDHAEWVVVLRGAARIQFEGNEPIALHVGDYLNIQAHARHRVDWTTPDEPTIWLAVHY